MPQQKQPITPRQREILAAALATDGRVLPHLPLRGGLRLKMAGALLRRGLVEEVPAGPDEPSWRTTPDGQALTLAVSAQGRAAVEGAAAAKEDTKTAQALELLRRGATVTELAQALGWQPHSVRALLSHGLPMRGHRIVRERQPGCRASSYKLAV